jgi:predicted sulfurtransferase
MALGAFCLYVLPAAAVEFPGRQKTKYKSVQPIEIEELYQDYVDNKVNIIDVRSKLEYDTIHIDSALHIPVTKRSFESELRKVVAGAPGKKTAFY